jgi:hypothetical protein
MIDIITNEIEGYQGVDRANFPRKTATASWQRSVLIITALSTLAWAAVVLVVIEALAHL